MKIISMILILIGAGIVAGILYIGHTHAGDIRDPISACFWLGILIFGLGIMTLGIVALVYSLKGKEL